VTEGRVVMTDIGWLMLLGLLSTLPVVAIAISLLWLICFTKWEIQD
jgi:hypothetical protein